MYPIGEVLPCPNRRPPPPPATRCACIGRACVAKASARSRPECPMCRPHNFRRTPTGNHARSPGARRPGRTTRSSTPSQTGLTEEARGDLDGFWRPVGVLGPCADLLDAHNIGA